MFNVIYYEPLSKRFSLVKVKAGENFNRRNTWSIERIKIFAQRRDRPKWDVLKLAPMISYMYYKAEEVLLQLYFFYFIT